MVGRREMFLVGLVLFTLTSAAAGLAPSEHLLVVARLLQGAAAGLLTPQNSGLIQQLFSGEERGRAFGLFGTTVGVSSAIGPVLGGLIIAAFGTDDGWRWVFFVNVPIGLLGMVLALRWLPKAEPREGSVRSQIDGVGSLLLGVAVLAVLLPIVEAMGDPATPLWFAGAARAGRGVGVRALGAPGGPARGRAAARRTAVRAGARATPRGSCSARRTSAASAASGWCSRCTSRTASGSPRCSRG